MATVKLELYKGKKHKNGEHPILIRISHEKDNKYLGTKVSAFIEEWDNQKNEINVTYKKNHNLNKVEFDTIKMELSHRLNKVKAAILSLEGKNSSYTITDILNQLEFSHNSMTFCNYTKKLIEDMYASRKIGNALNYQTVSNNVKCFIYWRDKARGKFGISNQKELKKLRELASDEDIALDKINYRWLCDFEKFHLSKSSKSTNSNPVNGLNVYMRALRAILNKAIKEGIIKQESNPFGKNGYEIQSSPVTKRAINLEKINKIRSLEFPEKSVLWHTKNYFLFSFYCRGMNWTDMAHLKLSNIIDERIVYVRIKTMRKNAKTFSIKITPQIREILNYYIIEKSYNDYIFPIIFREDEIGKRNDVHNGLKNFNKYLKRIGTQCGIERKMTSYVSRHSWGSIAKKEFHIETAIISQGYGHQDESTTKAYLADFDDDELDKANDLITK